MSDPICHVTSLLVLLALLPSAATFDLLLMHTNDFHDRIQETNKYSGSCSPSNAQKGKCFGGVSRLKTKIDELRASHGNSLLLDGGDQFQGTLWFYHYGGEFLADFMNRLGYDAMALGNHEFDNGISGLVPFLNKTNFSVLSSNVDLSDTPTMQDLVQPSTVITRGGEKIGVIGYTTHLTPYISSPQTVKFKDELESIQAEADRLTGSGINKIVALGHAGFMGDVEMAKKLRGVDIIVGGHSNTFLYNGNPPSNEDPSGGYPYEVTSDSGSRVLVVQSYAYGKYLGALNLTFDDTGVITSYNGNPFIMDSSVSKDLTIQAVVDTMSPEIEALQKEEVGSTHVLLDGDARRCRVTECNLGNLITDAMLKQNLKHADSPYWSDVGIAVMNSGGIRSSIEKGQITIGDIINVQPFRNSVDILEIRGSTLLKMLEFGATYWTNSTDLFGGFLQVSGLQVVYDMTRPVGSRVVVVKAKCVQCQVPRFEPLNKTAVYKVVMNTFLAAGGDGFSFIPEEKINQQVIGNIDSDLTRDYIKATSPMVTSLEGRIRHLQDVQADELSRHLFKPACRTESSTDSSSFVEAHPGHCLLSFLLAYAVVKLTVLKL